VGRQHQFNQADSCTCLPCCGCARSLLLLLQLGSWVPASACVLSVFDGVFTRMGTSDCLMLGRSTFAEELGEASHILATATNRCEAAQGQEQRQGAGGRPTAEAGARAGPGLLSIVSEFRKQHCGKS
jgi:hypothetical protein